MIVFPTRSFQKQGKARNSQDTTSSLNWLLWAIAPLASLAWCIAFVTMSFRMTTRLQSVSNLEVFSWRYKTFTLRCRFGTRPARNRSSLSPRFSIEERKLFCWHTTLHQWKVFYLCKSGITKSLNRPSQRCWFSLLETKSIARQTEKSALRKDKHSRTRMGWADFSRPVPKQANK